MWSWDVDFQLPLDLWFGSADYKTRFDSLWAICESLPTTVAHFTLELSMMAWTKYSNGTHDDFDCTINWTRLDNELSHLHDLHTLTLQGVADRIKSKQIRLVNSVGPDERSREDKYTVMAALPRTAKRATIRFTHHLHPAYIALY